MDLNFSFTNILILFGALQGIILCIFLWQKRKINKRAVFFFLLFIFSLAFFNLIYAFLNMDLFKYYRPLHMFPYPYKWLMGAGVYFYVKNHFNVNDRPIYHKKEWWLLAPAIAYGLLRTYWFAIAVDENSYRITWVIVESGFFRIHEIFYLVFGIVLGVAALVFINRNKDHFNIVGKQRKVLNWLHLFTKVFVVKTIIDLLIYILDLTIHSGEESFLLYYPTLLLNSAFIYWIGYVGFTKPNLFFSLFNQKIDSVNSERDLLLKKSLKELMIDAEVFTNPLLNLNELANQMNCSAKELSALITSMEYDNFSAYINHYRVEKVKDLLSSPDAEKYTLVSLAEEAGFSSKSSFNATFKKMTGSTPSAYKRDISSS